MKKNRNKNNKKQKENKQQHLTNLNTLVRVQDRKGLAAAASYNTRGCDDTGGQWQRGHGIVAVCGDMVVRIAVTGSYCWVVGLT